MQNSQKTTNPVLECYNCGSKDKRQVLLDDGSAKFRCRHCGLAWEDRIGNIDTTESLLLDIGTKVTNIGEHYVTKGDVKNFFSQERDYLKETISEEFKKQLSSLYSKNENEKQDTAAKNDMHPMPQQNTRPSVLLKKATSNLDEHIIDLQLRTNTPIPYKWQPSYDGGALLGWLFVLLLWLATVVFIIATNWARGYTIHWVMWVLASGFLIILVFFTWCGGRQHKRRKDAYDKFSDIATFGPCLASTITPLIFVIMGIFIDFSLGLFPWIGYVLHWGVNMLAIAIFILLAIVAAVQKRIIRNQFIAVLSGESLNDKYKSRTAHILFCAGLWHSTLDSFLFDDDKAQEFFDESKKLRHPRAHIEINQLNKKRYLLACRYYKGEGLEKDYKLSAYWCTKAAEQGHAEAQYNLGISYYQGEGVDKDIKKAVYWYAKAAEQGHKNAQESLDAINSGKENI